MTRPTRHRALDNRRHLDYVVVVNNIMEGYVTVDEAARRLGRSIEQVRRYLREGRLRGQRIGGQWFVEESALDEWHGDRTRSRARIGEAVAAYEERAMRTGETNKNERLISEELSREIEGLREEMRTRSGEFDVVDLLRKDREEH